MQHTEFQSWLSRRRFLTQAAVGGAALGAAALIGCGDDDDDDAAPAATAAPAGTAAPAATATATATAAPAGTAAPAATAAATAAAAGTATPTAEAAAPGGAKTGGFLRYITPPGISPTNLDPYYTDRGISNLLFGKFIYESLIEVDFTNSEWRSPYNLVGHLAESWEQQPDAVTYIFNIRPGVAFHNGATLTADDAVFSLGKAQDPEANNNAFRRSVSQPVEAVDDLTLRVVGNSPDAEFLEVLNGYIGQVAMMPRSFADGGGDFTREAVGTGPFRLTSHQAGSTALLSRFENYWQPGRPYLDGIHIVWDTADATLSAAFIAKEADILTRNDGVQAKPVLAANPDALSDSWASDYIYGPFFNLTRKPFDDLRVRQALHLTIDREEAEAVVTFGDGVISGPMMIVREGYTLSQADLLQQPGYRRPKDADIAEAVKLLGAAGYGDGFSMDMGFRSDFAFAESYATNLKQQYGGALNVDVTIRPLESALMREVQTQSGEYDTLLTSVNGVARPGSAVARWHSSHPNAAAQGINDPELDALLDAQKLSFDPEVRGEIFQNIESRLFEQMYFAGISAASLFRMWQPWVQNWRGNRARFGSIMNPSWISLDLDTAPDNRKSPPS